MTSTEKCVICFNEATHSGGHVHSGNDHIIAKFCEAHFNERKKYRKGNCIGCYGLWKEVMGIDNSTKPIEIDSEEVATIEEQEQEPNNQ